MAYTFPNTLLFEKRGHVAYITLNRPDALNALAPEMGEGIKQASLIIESDPDIYVAIITGTDRAFCTGADLKAMNAGNAAGTPRAAGINTERFFSEVTKPIIAAVNGFAVAGGCELMLGTDIRVACEEAQFGVPETRWALIPGGGGTIRLPRQIPYVRAMEILLIADRITAAQAEKYGLINYVVPKAELMATAERIANRICENGPYATRRLKEVVKRSYNMGWAEAFYTESELMKDVRNSEDSKEGPKAFTEKRKPVFLNR